MTTSIRNFPPAIALWAGLECTVARIGDTFRNQSQETGHASRPQDLDAIAGLGIRTVRYPVLWETIAPDDPAQCDWRWHDERLARLRTLGIEPIAGLVHHGSGPHYTDLLDPAFPALLAQHALRVASRYPWITQFTPVNEPLTTARFSGLYGHWYPHGRSMATFLQALVTQCRAIVLSMQAIRRVTPEAQLVQTEDLGKIFSTPPMAYQAEHENQRRWLGFDLLCGRVDRTHPWYQDFLAAGIDSRALGFFEDNRCLPDIVGINHYLTSERFLDHRRARYPAHHQSGNLREQYADVEAVRIDFESVCTGPQARLLEAWERYRLPLAVTEAHHGCSRDEQLRWLMEVWQAAHAARAAGADLRAVTIWSLFGCVDWNTLLTQQTGFYESGVFDARCQPPRPTILADAARALASTGSFDHPVLDRPGWWRRADRFYQLPATPALIPPAITPCSPRRIAITGATGTLGQAFARICGHRGLDCDLLARAEMDIGSAASIDAALQRYRPWAVVNAAGYVRVNQAEQEAERCFRENATGAELLARACARRGIPYVTFSSDLVFDGSLGRAYVESDLVCPTGIYGSSKVAAERLVAKACPSALVIRTSAFFGPWDRYNFVHGVVEDLNAGRMVEASDRVMVSPTYVPDLVHAALDLLIDRASGVWHLANQGLVSWHALALRVAQAARIDASALVRTEDGSHRITALTSERGLILPPLEEAIDRYLQDRLRLA
ncbi:MAG: sugar nucleotide-binding protein [Herminiimonas sp.]|nr:sugar nucleotide-binding protein [Herminiimonas sp.]